MISKKQMILGLIFLSGCAASSSYENDTPVQITQPDSVVLHEQAQYEAQPVCSEPGQENCRPLRFWMDAYDGGIESIDSDGGIRYLPTEQEDQQH